METEVSTIVFSKDCYSGNDEEAKKLMWNDVEAFLQILMNNEYTAVIRDDESDIIVVEYAHDERKDAWGGVYPVWITEKQKSLLEDTETAERENAETDEWWKLEGVSYEDARV